MSLQTHVGYIGLGNIGKPVATRLISDAYSVHVFDVDQEAVQSLVEQGATACESLAELASQCEHIGVCVRDDAQVESLLYGDAGLLSNAGANTVIAIHSTVTQERLLKWSDDASSCGIFLIDAPMTGGAHRAEAGTLCYMVGGDDAILDRSHPILMRSAEKVVHAGGVGAGIALKLCNNFIQYTEFVAMAEATRLAEACGLSVDVLRDVGLSNGVVNEQMHMFVSARNSLAASASDEDMQQFFGAMGALGSKDLECAIATAAAHSVTLPTAEYVRDRIEDVFLARDASRPAQAGDCS